MSISKHIAKQFRDIHFGGNWTVSNMRDTLKDITWQQATSQVYDFNTIAVLTYHSAYFVNSLLGVLKGGPLEGKDIYSFSHPPIKSHKDWEDLLDNVWTNAEKTAELIELLPDEMLTETFSDPKYGNYLRNILGIIEHMHYHLGQIVILKKLLLKL